MLVRLPILVSAFLAFASSRALAGPSAEDILAASGVQGGLVAHVGCGGGELTAAWSATESYLVQGLDEDAALVSAAQDYVRKAGLSGRASFDTFDGRQLPYVDDLVDLLVVSDDGSKLSAEEIARVLAPRGVALVRGGRDLKPDAPGLKASSVTLDSQPWTRLEKPCPDTFDDWTHFLYDASGNAVSKDDRVGSPRRVQWMAGPKRARDHDALSSTSVMTSSGGRVFYIFDEGPTSLIHRPASWRLVARDAFNGVLLWKRDIPTWVTHLHFFRTGPTQMTRRLVSVGDRVLVTLGLDAPITMLDAATGRTLLTYPGSERTEELILHDGTLLAVIGDPSLVNDEAPKVYGYWELSVDRKAEVAKSIVAYDAESGDMRWKKTGENLAYLAPLSLCALGERAFYLDNECLHCLDAETGEEQWKTSFPTEGLFLRNYAPTVVASNDVIMCLTWDRLAAFSIEEGEKLWEHGGAIGFASPGDLFAIDGLAWSIPMTAAIWRGNKLGRDGKIASGVNIPRESFLGRGGAEIWGMDLHTGEVKRSLPRSKLLPGGHHHRCYRNKATQRYLICGRRGLEYVDLKGEDHVNNWHLRGACQYGVMPANGLIYVPPDPCQCFNFIKLNGFCALAARSSLDDAELPAVDPLVEGPAYVDVAAKGKAPQRTAASAEPAKEAGRAWHAPVRCGEAEDWPTYRADLTRSGSTQTRLPAKLETLWKAPVGEGLTAPVIAGGRLLVCEKDAHAVHCLDAATGKTLWQFVASGRVDSPPTVWDGLCVFGCGDGRVYCLRASDGELAWRLRAAPVDRRVVADNRLESVWPISGSVLVVDGVAYCAAGRSSYLDGGIRLLGLDVYTGEKLHEARVAAEPVRPGQGKPEARSTGALADVLVSDGETLNMRQVQFDRSLVQREKSELKTLLATTGLLEDCWAHRQNWCLGYPGRIDVHRNAGGARARGRGDRFPSGKLLAFNDRIACGVQNPYTWLKHTGSLHPPTHDGHLHQKYSRYRAEWFPVGTRMYAMANRQGKRTAATADSELWAVEQPFQPRALVLTGDLLMAAGWLDRVAIEERTGRPLDAACPDPRPSVLRAIGVERGETLAEYDLPAEPVFDGMAAAQQRLYLSLKDGTVQCLGAPGAD